MARLPLSNQKKIVASCIVIYKQLIVMVLDSIAELMCLLATLNVKVPKHLTYKFDVSLEERMLARLLNLRPMIQGSDVACLENLRMDRVCFSKLCEMLRDVGQLQGNRNTSLEEMVAIFLFILSHDTKNRRVQLFFRRSGETLSRHFNSVLRAVLRCHHILFKKPEPVTDDNQDERWKWFKNCLGALDGTHIKVRVGDKDKVRFRNRKGELTTNVLAVCTRDMQFVYVLPGWEGSAHDCRFLRDALSRPNPLKVPQDMSQSQGKDKENATSTRVCSRWTNAEDHALVSAMQDLIDLGGWKTDNGQFKNGAYARLEMFMEQKIPGCGKKAKPHIESRVKLVRKHYDAIVEMLSPQASGFGWMMRESLLHVLNQYGMIGLSHKNAIGLRNKPFPLFDELGKIYGKDRANGREGGSIPEALEDMENEEGYGREEEEEVPISNSDGVFSVTQNSPVEPEVITPSRSKTKRARTETIEALKEFSSRLGKMNNVMEITGEHIGRLAKCFQHESESAERRMKVASEVMKIEGLTPAEVIMASKKIALIPLEVDFFFSLPDDFRYTFVQGLLIPDQHN